MAERLSETIQWQGHEIEITCIKGWPIASFCHIEVRCAARLPITETGYKSHFMPLEVLEEYASPVEFVEAWLDHAAKDKSWLRHVEESRQGDLFDL